MMAVGQAHCRAPLPAWLDRQVLGWPWAEEKETSAHTPHPTTTTTTTNCSAVVDYFATQPSRSPVAAPHKRAVPRFPTPETPKHAAPHFHDAQAALPRPSFQDTGEDISRQRMRAHDIAVANTLLALFCAANPPLHQSRWLAFDTPKPSISQRPRSWCPRNFAR